MAEEFGGYSGQEFTLRGGKDRFTLPPALRKAVALSSGDRILCLTKHERFRCLVGFGLSRKADLYRKIDREEQFANDKGQPFDRDTRQGQLFGFRELPFDASGRFVMPDHLVKLAKLEDGVFFNGAGDHFTLWSPAELYRMDESWEVAQAACRMLEKEAGKKG